MTAIYGMMAMVPVLFASAGYVLVSSDGTAELKGHNADEWRGHEDHSFPMMP